MVPTIPSNTFAPPEDKTMFTVSDQSERFIDTQVTGNFLKGTRQSEHIMVAEKTTNPNVGPGSYDPVIKAKLDSTINTDWARGSERFKSPPNKAGIPHLA